jgi:hypothetical protein
LRFSPEPVGDTQVMALLGAASEFAPFLNTQMPGTAAELRAFATGAVEVLESLQPESSGNATVFVAKAPNLEGTYVNGVKVEEAPKLEDYFSLEDRLNSGPHSYDPFPLNAKLTEHGVEIDVSVKVETGGNVLINNVMLKSFWTASGVTAVVGDHIEINAIIQVNAWCDNDAVTSAIESWNKDPAETQAFNIATFERYDTSKQGQAADITESFPSYWVIKEIKGDLMIVNWLQQLTFMMDNDIGILSSSGVTTCVYSGGNIAYNGISIYELAFAYDLIPSNLLDHIMVKNAEQSVASIRVSRLDQSASDRERRIFGSDHHPMLARIEFTPRHRRIKRK